MTTAVPPVLVSPLQRLVSVPSAALCTIAQQTAARLLGPLGARWPHTVGVAQRAAAVADALELDADVLVAAAWLHDVGSARVAVVTGFAPLDGARYLAEQLWPLRIAGLVAHHRGARFAAAARGLDRALAAYPDEGGPMADALAFADRAAPCVPGCAEADDLRAAVARVERRLLHRRG